MNVRAVELYDTPVALWKKLLGEDLHFHLGHFPSSRTTLNDAMRIAVDNLAAHMPRRPIERVLDVGCGWGGPAFQLAARWGAAITALTSGLRQVRYVNRAARRRGLPVAARLADAETCSFGDFGSFDVVWAYEVLEHIANRRALLDKLAEVCTPAGSLALAVNCRAPHVFRPATFSPVLGTYPLDTFAELSALLRETGWRILWSADCTRRTLRVWDVWLGNLRSMSLPSARPLVNALCLEFASLRRMYTSQRLQSMQLVARRSGRALPHRPSGAPG